MKTNRQEKLLKETAAPDNGYLPHDEGLEQAVLGALLLESQYISDVRSIITPAAFYHEKNATLYGIICRLDDKGETPNLITVVQKAKMEHIAPSYVVGLTQLVGSGVDVKNHALRLADLELRRRLILFSSELMSQAQTNDDVTEWATVRLDEIVGAASSIDTARHIGDVLAENLQELEQRQRAHQCGECVGIPTGLSYLDRITGGWRGGQLVILGARPAMGKTALSLLFARAAASTGIPVCMFSLEMPDTQLTGRMLVGASNTDANAFRSGDVTTDNWRQLECSASELKKLPVYLIDTASTTMARIRSQSRTMQRRGKCGMIIIDYLQLVAPTVGKRDNREREVADISRSAKLLAKELNIPVILLAQLSRKVEERADKVPLLSDLRESGAIEQDADMVIFIDRPAYYGIETFDAGRYGVIDSAGVGRLTIAKNREGRTGFIPFRHNESLTRIADYTVPPAKPTP